MTAQEAGVIESRAAAPAASGANQTGVRLYNERLVLSLMRRRPHLSKIEVARLTGLSVQTASAIMNHLQADGLLRRETPQRGRVGQPTVPFSLDPEGAFSLGFKIGRRSCDLVLVDFAGVIRERVHETFAYPQPAPTLDFAARALPALLGRLTPRQRTRLVGLGLATPFYLWNWGAEVGAPPGAMDVWRNVNIKNEIAALCPVPVILCNDASSACAAEFFFGDGWRHHDFLYFFLGSFIGGGVVIDGALFTGRTGTAGALGPIPIMQVDEKGQLVARQLIHCASIYRLEQRLRQVGVDPSSIWRTPDSWDDFSDHLDEWLEETARALAYACLAAISVLDFEAVVIDGAMPVAIRARLVARVAEIYETLDRRGLVDPLIRAGSVGADARALGGAALPLLANFARDREVLFKEPPNGSA
ncbi:MAG TPA: ROK family transcriptional regulator [Roseiarcus sp.]|nr:ROK family transcriptional regulator [Roseiarcus sp.]